ncbi:molybdopterin molybdotransferase MoeA [Promicromonospora sp. NPDC052451]|uniref:molybdopterin molybdotransferase MoeA n=1 Tax=Promicromonospora sp. NPDC052451 TaxID=3364407 RepID=UPI0037C99B86
MEQRLRGVTEHIERVLGLVAPLPARSVDVADALGEVVAEDLYAAVSVPPFDSAAMDGYAVRLTDLPPDGSPVTLRVTGDVAAGPGDPDPVGPGQAVRIMTGAPLPPGADAVVPVEHTSTGRFVAGAPRTEDSVTLTRRPRPHVRAAGEDVRRGELLARAGTEVTAALVGALAASGTVRVPARRRPLVAVISTGAELVPVGSVPGPGQITDSNGPMLAAAARAAGADVVRIGPVPDDPAALRAALDEAVGQAVGGAVGAGAGGVGPDAGGIGPDGGGDGPDAGGIGPDAGPREPGHPADLVVTAGGVSAGAADVVREVLGSGAWGADATDVDVAAVAMSPGRPQALARWRGVPWLALPGNPVGAYASFELFVRPAVDRLRGRPAEVGHSASTMSTRSNLPSTAVLPAAADWPGSPGRLLVVPVRVVRPPGTASAALPGPAGHLTSPPPDAGADPTLLDAPGVVPLGSRHSLSALACADGLALVPPDVEKVRAGDPVEVLMLR